MARGSGGQTGMGWLLESKLFDLIIIVVALVAVESALGLLSCSAPTPDEKAAETIANWNNDCVTADLNRRAGKDYNETLWNDKKCQDYLVYAAVEEKQDQRNELERDAPETQQADGEPHVDENGYTILEVEP